MTAKPTAPGLAFVALDERGAALARTLSGGLGGAVHGLSRRVADADVAFDDVADHLRMLFNQGTSIVGVMAAGILVRALAPVLADKTAEPAVVAVSSDGAHAVPVLGGHRGANALAEKIAGLTGGMAAVTTASDAILGVALDAPPPGWAIENEAAAGPLMARAVSGDKITVRVDAGTADWLLAGGGPFESVADAADIIISDRALDGAADTLVLRPPTLALGIGCERGADAAEVIALCEAALADAGLSATSVAVVVSIDVKADEPAVHAAADHFGVPARFFDAATLEAETPRLQNPSDVVFAEVGCHGVSEGAALAAVGATGALVQPKMKSARATAAIARAAGVLDASAVGRGQGCLTVVGIGPGTPDWRTGAAAATLKRVTDVVGYGLYLDLIADLTANATCHTSNLAEEEARARMALDLAAEGKDVALVSSGDAGIFALATLVFELLDHDDRDDWNRLDVSVTPGVSAFQAAAARIGAPMGHDFCAISLSDLLTPWPAIQNRLDAAGRGDFVVALYNPVSKRRRHQIEEARDILLAHRPATTPVVLARNLGRADEAVRVITLGALTADSADMLTMVVIGSSETRDITRGQNRWVYTPRGYGQKMDPKEGSKT